MALLDGQIITIKCPTCGHETDKEWTELVASSTFPCSGCHLDIHVTNVKEIEASVKGIEDALAELGGSIR